MRIKEDLDRMLLLCIDNFNPLSCNFSYSNLQFIFPTKFFLSSPERKSSGFLLDIMFTRWLWVNPCKYLANDAVPESRNGDLEWNQKAISRLMVVYSEHIVTFKSENQRLQPGGQKNLYSANESAMMSFLFILNPCMAWSCERNHCWKSGENPVMFAICEKCSMTG